MFIQLSSVAEYFGEFLLGSPWERAYLGLTGMHSGGMCVCVNVSFLFIQEAFCGNGTPFDHFFRSPLMPVSILHVFRMLI